jgi:hypothetical protein
MKWELKMEWLLLAIGLLVGGGAGFGVAQIGKKKPDAPTVVHDQTSEKQQDVVLQLTDLDLVREACSSEFIVTQEQGPLLCRELFCRMQQRGVDAKTGATECESISNVANKTAIHDFCEAAATTTEKIKEEAAGETTAPTPASVDKDAAKACVEFFDRRI